MMCRSDALGERHGKREPRENDQRLNSGVRRVPTRAVVAGRGWVLGTVLVDAYAGETQPQIGDPGLAVGGRVRGIEGSQVVEAVPERSLTDRDCGSPYLTTLSTASPSPIGVPGAGF